MCLYCSSFTKLRNAKMADSLIRSLYEKELLLLLLLLLPFYDHNIGQSALASTPTSELEDYVGVLLPTCIHTFNYKIKSSEKAKYENNTIC